MKTVQFPSIVFFTCMDVTADTSVTFANVLRGVEWYVRGTVNPAGSDSTLLVDMVSSPHVSALVMRKKNNMNIGPILDDRLKEKIMKP